MTNRNTVILALLGAFLLLFILSFAARLIEVPSAYDLRVSAYRVWYSNIFPLDINRQDDREKLERLHKVKDRKKADEKVTARRLSARCLGCHDNIRKAIAQPVGNGELDGKLSKKPMHQKMLTLPQLDFQCVYCHKSVDLRRRDPSHETIKVDRKFCASYPCHIPEIMAEHGENDRERGRAWVKKHPDVAKKVGLNEVCFKCHVKGTELFICPKCHEKEGFRPSHHKKIYDRPMNAIYPKLFGQPNLNTEVIQTTWIGYHFVFVRNELKKMGVEEVTPQTIPLDKIERLTCPACHDIKVWCTRCHIKHAPTWLDPNAPIGKGHPPTVIAKSPTYCWNCHSDKGTKCITCHTYVGQLISEARN